MSEETVRWLKAAEENPRDPDEVWAEIKALAEEE